MCLGGINIGHVLLFGILLHYLFFYILNYLQLLHDFTTVKGNRLKPVLIVSCGCVCYI